MNITEALIIIKKHQKWRLGDKRMRMTDPSQLTEAIGTIINYIDNHKDIINGFAKNCNFKITPKRLAVLVKQA